MDQTAADAYGFISYTPAFPGGLAVASATDVGTHGAPHEVLPKMGFGHSNPLFWVLILVLVITGYLTLGFNVGIKRVLKAGAKIG